MGLMLDWALALTTTSILTALVSLICRIGHMHKGITKMSVFMQHLVLAAGLAFSLVLPGRYAAAPLAIAIALFLSIGAGRWRTGAPADTRKETASWK
jgi:hypothetical protein